MCARENILLITDIPSFSTSHEVLSLLFFWLFDTNYIHHSLTFESSFLYLSQLVRKLLKKDCLCHGISGSCQLKTCWKTLPQFREIGDTLMKKYTKAKKVVAQKTNTGINLAIKRSVWLRLVYKIISWTLDYRTRSRGDKESIRPKNSDLVYLEESPYYCRKNISLGSSGEKIYHIKMGWFCKLRHLKKIKFI